MRSSFWSGRERGPLQPRQASVRAERECVCGIEEWGEGGRDNTRHRRTHTHRRFPFSLLSQLLSQSRERQRKEGWVCGGGGAEREGEQRSRCQLDSGRVRLFAVESVRDRDRERERERESEREREREERRGGYSFAEVSGPLQLSRPKNLSSAWPGL